MTITKFGRQILVNFEKKIFFPKIYISVFSKFR